MDEINRVVFSTGITKSITKTQSLADWRKLKAQLLVWVFGFVFALVPIFLYFIQTQVDDSPIRHFFRNAEILYMCVLMGVVSLSEMTQSEKGIRFYLTLFIMIIGTALYAFISAGVDIPFMNYANRLPNLNKVLFVLIFFMGIWGYWKMCRKMSVISYLKARKDERK